MTVTLYRYDDNKMNSTRQARYRLRKKLRQIYAKSFARSMIDDAPKFKDQAIKFIELAQPGNDEAVVALFQDMLTFWAIVAYIETYDLVMKNPGDDAPAES